MLWIFVDYAIANSWEWRHFKKEWKNLREKDKKQYNSVKQLSFK